MGRELGAERGVCQVCEFRSDDLDEAVEFVAHQFGPHARVPQARGPIGFSIEASLGPHAAAGIASSAIPYTLRAATQSVTVHLPLQHGAEYRVGRRRLCSAKNVAVVLPTGHDYSLLSPGGQTLAIQLDPLLLTRHLDDRACGSFHAFGVIANELRLTPTQLSDVGRLVGHHRAAVEVAQESGSAQRVQPIERRMASWLADRMLDSRGIKSLSPSGRDAAERVEAWIRSHFWQPITLEKLTSVAGVGVRTLQEACKARWGQSPMEIVVARRLEFVRALLTATPTLTVTSAAVRGGFSHLGRFAVLYRNLFGESPSDTLARARERTAKERSQVA